MKVTGWVMTNKVGSKSTFTVEVDDESLEGLSKEEREVFIDKEVYEAMTNYLEWGWAE